MNEAKLTQKQYPKHESHCCGAPVNVHKGEKIKYTCSECGNPCIARSKK